MNLVLLALASAALGGGLGSLWVGSRDASPDASWIGTGLIAAGVCLFIAYWAVSR